jgi:heat shock protein HslJ
MQASQRYSLSQDSLELVDTTGAVKVRFRPAGELPVVGVAWRLVGYAGSEGGMVSPLAGTQISLSFLDDGTLAGIAGCNSYSADYEIDGDEVVIGGVSHTEMACLDPTA